MNGEYGVHRVHGEYGVHRECMESMEYIESAWRVWST